MHSRASRQQILWDKVQSVSATRNLFFFFFFISSILLLVAYKTKPFIKIEYIVSSNSDETVGITDNNSFTDLYDEY